MHGLQIHELDELVSCFGGVMTAAFQFRNELTLPLDIYLSGRDVRLCLRQMPL
jgi:hypothetical protein